MAKIDKQLQKDIHQEIVEILKDCLNDKKNVIRRLQATITLLVCLLFATFCGILYFFNEYDYENTITTTTTTKADNKNYQNNSSINSSIKDIQVNIPKVKTEKRK